MAAVAGKEETKRMKKKSLYTVKEVSDFAGVSVRTLHYYDQVGLLKPSTITKAGYRLYDNHNLRRLQSILLLKELQFTLKDISDILESPSFDQKQALCEQIKILELQKNHIEQLIAFAKRLQKQEKDISMTFDAFNTSELEAYKAEVKTKWGTTSAYKEFTQREQQGSDFAAAGEQMMNLFDELGQLRHLPADSEEVQAKVASIQQFITDNFYTCTKEIFAGLGQMYAADSRFKENIDKVGGEGTAEFASKAIAVYCK